MKKHFIPKWVYKSLSLTEEQNPCLKTRIKKFQLIILELIRLLRSIVDEYNLLGIFSHSFKPFLFLILVMRAFCFTENSKWKLYELKYAHCFPEACLCWYFVSKGCVSPFLPLFLQRSVETHLHKWRPSVCAGSKVSNNGTTLINISISKTKNFHMDYFVISVSIELHCIQVRELCCFLFFVFANK